MSIYFNTNTDDDLDTFAHKFFNIIGVSEYVPRQSSNYIGEKYYRATSLGIVIKLSIADDSHFDNYQFNAYLETGSLIVENRSVLDAIADVIARNATQHGISVARDLNFGKAAGRKLTYTLVKSDSGKAERIDVVESDKKYK